MSYRDIRDAEEALFGGPTYSMSVRMMPPGGEDRPSDMAQAWLEGRYDEVLAFAAAHEVEVRSRPVHRAKRTGRPPAVDRAAVMRALGEGKNLRETAEQCGCSISSVWRVRDTALGEK